MPLSKRSIVDLYLIEQMTEEEIAEIKKLPVSKIDSVIRQVCIDIKYKLIESL